MERETKKPGLNPFYLILFILIIGCPIGLIATQTAWGEWSIDELGIMMDKIPSGIKNGFSFEAIMPDYSIPAVKNGIAGYIISAVTGTAVLLIIFKFFSAFVRKKAAGHD